MKSGWSTYSLVDTNVWVYAIDYSDEFKQEIANELLESALDGEVKLATSTQVLAEVANVCIRLSKNNPKADPNCANLMISALNDIDDLPKLIVEPKTIFTAINLQREFALGFFDALIAATMKEHGITTIYTEDKEFEKIDGIKAVNPFERRKRSIA